MKRLLGSISSLNIIVLIMLGMIFAALIAPHFSNGTKCMRATRASRATANTPVSR
jgi:hypothetical protein